MQEHIRRAHPNHYIPKLPATEESFLLMVNTPLDQRAHLNTQPTPSPAKKYGIPLHDIISPSDPLINYVDTSPPITPEPLTTPIQPPPLLRSPWLNCITIAWLPIGMKW